MSAAPRPEERVLEVARDSGLIVAREPLLVMISGGADSVCLLDVAVRLEASVTALHVNYGLRPGADGDAEHCRSLCERLGVPLIAERAELGGEKSPPAAPEPSGNLQSRAREVRYALAERHAVGDYATAHTRSDQAETVLYRLAVSPGRRALLGIAPRRGRLVRPLLGAGREETRAYCEARGLAWREDPSNRDPDFARARIRHEVLPVLSELNPEVEQAIAETSALLRDEADVIDARVDEVLGEIGAAGVLSLAELRALPAGLARLVLRRAAEAAHGGPFSLSRRAADAVLELGRRGGTATLDLGSGLRAVAEYGTLRFARRRDADPPEPVELNVPGTARFGEWQVEARTGGPGEVLVSAAELGAAVTVRAWRHGDRMQPAGVGGTKSLQDLFTDRKIPRSLRRSLPVVEAGGEIVWVAGAALGERFRVDEAAAGEQDVVGLRAWRVRT